MLNIDMVSFTPTSSFIGGVLIGIAVVIFFVSNGKLAGVSGIVNNALTKNHNRVINLLFLFGLILGPLVYMFFFQTTIPLVMTSSIPIIIVGGLLVGIGTKIGSGCTSGHGICGISRFSFRSILATLIFMIVAMITVFALKWLGIT